ncbi:MAG: translation initiation factor IF-2 [Candidatus Aminicenantes bacterium]|nr:translation initiation factor IF-2 [Candidatus Aminicenantes bacterium]
MNDKKTPKSKATAKTAPKDAPAKKTVKDVHRPAPASAKPQAAVPSKTAPVPPSKSVSPKASKPADPAAARAVPAAKTVSPSGHKPSAAPTRHPVHAPAPAAVHRPLSKPAAKPEPKAVKEPSKAAKTEPQILRRRIVVTEGTDIKSLCEMAETTPRAVLEKLSARRITLSAGDAVEDGLIEKLSQATGHDLEWVTVEEAAAREAERRADEKIPRPPVVTIMGHVDHGKTTLLDAIRASNLVDKESGGITQHIGAYQVQSGSRQITFIDTPGHEAFTRLRSRGARVTDIVVLVVAADEGLMPQTREAISHAQAAGVPIIVAVNKIDRPEANVERVKQQLSKEGLLVEEWGGKIVSVDISAKEKKNIKELLEMILLVADLQEIKGHPTVPAQGVVLEARLDSKKGPLATILIRQGRLSVGEFFICGTTSGKVRALFDEHGRSLKTADMSAPVEVLGFGNVPEAGEAFQVVSTQEEARKIVAGRLSRKKKPDAVKPPQASLDELFKRIEEGVVKDLSLVVKADVQGSVEVLKDILPGLSTERVQIKIVHSGTGVITDSDVLLASASKAVVLGYNVKAGQKTLDLAKQESVEVRTYSVIYKLTDDLKKAVAGLLEPVVREVTLGKAEIRKIFRIPKVGVIAGCYVTDGKIRRGAEARIIRGQGVLFKARITSLKHVKESVTEVQKNFECGIGLDKAKDIQEGDVIEAFVTETVAPA